jgi:hypothetical protein
VGGRIAGTKIFLARKAALKIDAYARLCPFMAKADRAMKGTGIVARLQGMKTELVE